MNINFTGEEAQMAHQCIKITNPTDNQKNKFKIQCDTIYHPQT